MSGLNGNTALQVEQLHVVVREKLVQWSRGIEGWLAVTYDEAYLRDWAASTIDNSDVATLRFPFAFSQGR